MTALNITMTGSLGHIGRPLAEILVKNGHKLTVIASDPEKMMNIKSLGANPAIGSVNDVEFLVSNFKGADAVFTMVPPNWSAGNYLQYIADTGKIYAQAIGDSGVQKVVNLSSMGAQLGSGTGPIAGLHTVEKTLNSLDGVAVKHLRPGLFYVNFYFDIPVIRKMGVMGNNYGKETKLVMAHPKDIAAAAAQELENLIEGKSHRYIAGDELEISEITRILGKAIDNPDLPWVQFSDDETLSGMIGAGMSEAIARLYVEMGHAISTGLLFEDFLTHRPGTWGKIKLRDFAEEFGAVYKSMT